MENAMQQRKSAKGRPCGTRSLNIKSMRMRNAVLSMREEGKTIEQIATELKICKNTVMKAIHRDMEIDKRETIAFVRKMLSLAQSIAYESHADCRKFSDAYMLLDEMEKENKTH